MIRIEDVNFDELIATLNICNNFYDGERLSDYIEMNCEDKSKWGELEMECFDVLYELGYTAEWSD